MYGMSPAARHNVHSTQTHPVRLVTSRADVWRILVLTLDMLLLLLLLLLPCFCLFQAWLKDQLGADEVVDYTSSDFAAEYAAPDKQFDIVVDCLVS
jgi:hypothetical protein